MAKEQGKKSITLSVESLQAVYGEAMDVRTELESATANQQKLKKDAVESLKSDEALKVAAQTADENITALVDAIDERALPLLEDVLESLHKRVKEAADNFVMTQVKEEATAVKDKIAGLKEQWEKLNTQDRALRTVMDTMGLDYSEVPEIQKLARGGGRPAGSGGTRTTKTKDFSFVYSKDGVEFSNWDTISRALFYSSAKSGGSASDGRLTVEEFKVLFNEKFGHSDDMRESWEIELPNGKKLGFTRKEVTQPEASTDGETEQPSAEQAE